MLHCIVGD